MKITTIVDTSDSNVQIGISLDKKTNQLNSRIEKVLGKLNILKGFHHHSTISRCQIKKKAPLIEIGYTRKLSSRYQSRLIFRLQNGSFSCEVSIIERMFFKDKRGGTTEHFQEVVEGVIEPDNLSTLLGISRQAVDLFYKQHSGLVAELGLVRVPKTKRRWSLPL